MLNGMMGSSGIMNGMTGGMLLPTLVNIFVIALVVVSIMLLVRLLQNRTSNNEQTAYTLLAERFACGDIGLEEDQERRSVLQGH